MKPHASCLGIDGYPRGWVAARRTGGAVTWHTCTVPEIASLLSDEVVVGIDMPIGLAEAGWRDCDRLAKTELGRAASRVFMTPPRGVLELGLTAPNEHVQNLSRQLTGQGTSRQALGLADRILALDLALTDALATVVEVHPELSFAELAGNPLASKKTARGVGERLSALRPWLTTIDAVLADAPPDVPIDDALDALAALWSAERWRDGTAHKVPTDAVRPPFIVT
jgi:predicted RNase H-like nuclease